MRNLMALGILALAGCSSFDDAKAAKEEDGAVEKYSASVQAVKSASIEVLKENGASKVEEANGRICAEFESGAFNSGCNVAVFVKAAGSGSEVSVVSYRTSYWHFGKQLTEGGFHDLLRAKLEKVAIK